MSSSSVPDFQQQYLNEEREKGLEWALTTHLVFLDTEKLHDADVEVPQASLAPVCHYKHEQKVLVSHNNKTAARKSEKQASKNSLSWASLEWPDPVEMRQGLSNDDPMSSHAAHMQPNPNAWKEIKRDRESKRGKREREGEREGEAE